MLRILSALILAASIGVGHAAAPSGKPITLIIGYSAGGAADLLGRKFAPLLERRLGRSVIVENVGGAGGTLAAGRVARAEPDGSTLLMTPLGHVTAPAMYPKLPYDTLNDFAGISMIATGRVMLVARPTLPVDTPQELIALAKQKPEGLSYGSSGHGALLHLAMEMFSREVGIQLLHVPYKSVSASLPAVVAGDVDLTLCTVAMCMPFVNDGRVKPLLHFGPDRAEEAPNMPSFTDLGLGDFDVSSYNLVLAPRKTPRETVEELHRAISDVVNSEDYAAQIKELSFNAQGSPSPESVDQLVASEVKKWSDLLGSINK